MSAYNRFENKDGLIVALAIRALEQLAEAIDVPEDVEPVERFRQSCRSYREFALRHPARYSLIFGAGSPLEDQSSAAADSGRVVFAILLELIHAMKEEAPVRGLTEDAHAVWSALHGAVTIEMARIGLTPDADSTFEHMLSLLTDGLTETPPSPRIP